ncbi:2-amino-4-hydroxy-6-hydroxymethyldihydropteridine diphosphokinase [Synechococcus sp. CCY 9618]|uniref:2-amino-4-hydroxy-6- hydroxymethyldihydropteridine diphosphokinase n=1 Tax=Synechococcus sp. CCY 9618 TaxID=2815602 RepID=UPI001C243D7D|nr:2-amino-4-hydroxy-6-hydroxymethyldihydropteridine diphosphokinase [Synechococcus sp. CCY 9618]
MPSIAIGLGANLGDSLAILLAVRPLLSARLGAWAEAWADAPRRGSAMSLRWSPLFRTVPVGGPPGQPPFLNGALLLTLPTLPSSAAVASAPAALLEELLRLEARFGRVRRERWGPRSLDLDLLWCGDLTCAGPELVLPHPRLGERTFVLAPLAAIDPTLRLPGEEVNADDRLAALLARPGEIPPRPLPGRPGWPEGP